VCIGRRHQAGVGTLRMPEPPPRTIRVAATGEASGAPDRLNIDLGVASRAATARQALSRANERAAALVELLGREGVAKSDIATRSISIHPHYDDKGRVAGYGLPTTSSSSCATWRAPARSSMRPPAR
jgi:uncharacterized protein YggE